MNTFLQLVAHDLYSKHGNDLSKIAIVFPNKRASLFFNEYLAKESNKPIWSPSYHSISELLESLSDWQIGDDIKLICKLYKVFQEQTNSEESLDDFYFWGELLLSDFDDIDKNKVDTDKLFSNLKDLKNIMDTYDFLDEEQEAAIQQFFSNFSIEKRTVLKDRFINLWNELGAIYTNFKKELVEEKIAYEGMLYRHNIEQLDTKNLRYEQYVFVGFNVLNKVEHAFFKKLYDANKALFYWDYDIFYTDNTSIRHEAGEFINRNLIDFPNQLDKSHFNQLNKPKQITYVSSATETAQARLLPSWIKSNIGEKEQETAVVLCNEALLLPTLHSIPEEVKNINITMGFPLAQTPIYSLIGALMELQNKGFNSKTGYFDYKSVLAVLKHPYTRQCSEQAKELEREIINHNQFYLLPSELHKDDFLSALFEPQLITSDFCTYLLESIELVTPLYRKEKDSDNVFDQLYRESLFKSYTVINRLYGMIDQGELPIQKTTLQHLIEKIMSSSNIPFHGEPAIGMQIMGVLETRNLDFKNLVMLSVNEGQLPKAPSESSFIPYNLRKGFGMTTIEHQNAVYAYYFYRLIQRAENITLCYNTTSEGLNKGEISRFMNQLLVEWPHPINREFIEAKQTPTFTHPIVMEKTEEVIAKLVERYDINRPGNKNAILSPSALNTYLDCKLKFYYRYVAGLRSPNEVSDEIDAALFGSIFHKAAETIYKQLGKRDNWIREEDIKALLKFRVKIEEHVDNAFKELFFKIAKEKKPPYNGEQLINSRVITSYIIQLLRNDLKYTPFQIEGMEVNVYDKLEVNPSSGPITIQIGGNIDRLDLKEGILRIVDYKTGGSPTTPADIEQLFIPSDRRPNHVFQTFLYGSIVTKEAKYKVAPSLLYINRAAGDDYSPIIEMGQYRNKVQITNFKMVEDEFNKRLRELISDIFEKDIAFDQTEFERQCEYCDFKSLCGR